MMMTCPVCKSTNAKLLHEYKSDYAAQYQVLQQVDPERYSTIKQEIERLWGGDLCSVLSCLNCEFCYASPFVSGDNRFYSLFYDSPSFPKWKWEYEATYTRLKIMSGALVNPMLLEIGAGTGMFLKRIIKDITIPENVVAVEYSESGRSEIEALDIKCIQNSIIEERHNFVGRFDVVCMYQVLEHMSDIDRLFSSLSEITSDKASLFIAVPNPNMTFFYEKEDAWRDMPPVHIGRWNKESFVLVGERHGWELEEYLIEPSSIVRRFIRFVLYKYVYNSKEHKTIYNWIESIRTTQLRYMLQVVVLVFISLKSIRLLSHFSKSDLGPSLLVELRKASPYQR